MSAKYTQAERDEALAVYKDHGAAEASRRTGINRATIATWASKGGVPNNSAENTRAATEASRLKAQALREELRLRILESAAIVLERLHSPHIDKKVITTGELAGTVVDVHHDLPTPSGAREYAVSFGILLDKYRLEMGEHTDRTKSDATVTVSEEQLEHDIGRIAAVVGLKRAS